VELHPAWFLRQMVKLHLRRLRVEISQELLILNPNRTSLLFRHFPELFFVPVEEKNCLTSSKLLAS
jgi:hypothetical protein